MQKFKSDLTTYFFKSVLKTIGFNDTGLPLCPDALILYLNERSIKLTVFKENSGKWNFIGVDMGLKYDHTFTENFTPFDTYEKCRDAGIIECCCYLNLQSNTKKDEEHKSKPIGPRGPGLKLFKSKLDEEKHDEEIQEETECQEDNKCQEDNEWIDLGFASGTLWRCRPEEGKFTYSEAITHECQFIDHERIPTKEQFSELLEYSNVELIRSDDKKAIAYKFTSAINGKSITLQVPKENCDFWSSSKSVHPERKYMLQLNCDSNLSVVWLNAVQNTTTSMVWFCKKPFKQDNKIADSTYKSPFDTYVSHFE